ncbi:hypothetical protein DSECCO2_629830 [anaerobic digester metagenome]
MSEGGEFLTKFAVVVDLAVEDDLERSVLVSHRLATLVGEIDDREAAMGEADRPGEERSFAVGPAMSQPLCHRPDESRIRLLPVQGKLPGNTAHTPGPVTYQNRSYPGPYR